MTDVERFRARFAYVIIAVLWSNAVLLALASRLGRANNPDQIVAAGIALAAFTTLVWWACGTSWITRQVSSITSLGQVMLLVYTFSGHPYQSDMHMYFFAILAVLAGWLDWRIFVPASLAVAAHHAVLSVVYPLGVFPNGNSFDRVLLHAVIVIVQALALSWTVSSLRAALETSEAEKQEATAARRAAEDARHEAAAMTQKAAQERKTMLYEVAEDFEHKIAGIAKDVIASVRTLRTASQQMQAGASEVAERAGAAFLSSHHTSSNVVAITNATSELATSFGEIDKQVGETTRIVGATTSKAKTVLATVNHLSTKAEDVGNIVGMISTIAEHTNLLALNAAIEAARFGRSGGGFTVVAQEIKTLANQTSRATEKIQGQIEAIRSSSEDAIRAIDAMNTTIGSLNEVSAAVATVVEQQSAATAGIASNIQVAAKETVSASGNIEIVSRIATETGAAAAFVAESADRLDRQSADLDLEVAQFLERIREA
ncbi:methyl-accepting chemotaxis protein [Bosea sp. OK403]|uniref:methyl-accepting chemotaxis protein n=1 Tax=Bosea sp. OK403 TaxID=1855286 RepID=UPI0008E35F7F|nr:methyl-accepting chemotaxis protein [Bosea sp. OK403]SFJ27126.1 methyl-accepting chemotaxis protein [Bosea sp. OK403]